MDNNINANVRGFIRTKDNSKDNSMAIQLFPNGYINTSRPDTLYAERFVDIGPINAYYFTEKQIITFQSNTFDKNCTLVTVDLNISNVT